MGLFTAKPVLVVDGTALLKARGVRGNAAPRQQLQILRTLSRTAQRENLKITAVFSGKPLDKAPHNKVVDGVRTRYAKTDDGLRKELKKALSQAGSCGVLVTEDPEFEKQVSGGNNTLRISTFRKMLDEGGDNAPSGGGRKRSRNNNRKPRNNKENRKSGGKKKNSDGGGQKQSKKKDDDPISQMIDLVD